MKNLLEEEEETTSTSSDHEGFLQKSFSIAALIGASAGHQVNLRAKPMSKLGKINNYICAYILIPTFLLPVDTNQDSEDLLAEATCHLDSQDLWAKFHDLGTEMIITKTGR